MIYTLTTNPAIDLNVSAASVVPNTVSRTTGAVYTPNGKGLNVSFTLKHYGVEAPILGFFGGFTGAYIVDGAREKGCCVHPVWVDGTTRVNTFISLTDGSGDEYKFPNDGCEVGPDAQAQMLELIGQLEDLSCLVVSGSLSKGMDGSFYDELIDVLEARGAEFVLDISHPHLAELIERRPLLIKPNDDELCEIFGLGVENEQEAVASLRELISRGAKSVLLTMGGKGAYFCDGEGVWRTSAPKIEFLSSLCAGDATLAAFLSLWYGDRSAVEPALKRAMATGGNVAASFGLGDFAQVPELERTIEVERIA